MDKHIVKFVDLSQDAIMWRYQKFYCINTLNATGILEIHFTNPLFDHPWKDKLLQLSKQ